MTLPFLPHQEIRPQFTNLKAQVDHLPEIDHVQQQWVENTLFSPKKWCAYSKAVHTNTDIEGWHHALKDRAGVRCNLPL